MAADHVEKTVKEIVAARFKVAPDTLTVDTRLREDLGGDSLDLIEIVFEVEQALDVVVREGPMHEIRTIGDAVRHLESLAQ